MQGLRISAFELPDAGELLSELGARLGGALRLRPELAPLPFDPAPLFDRLRNQYDATKLLRKLEPSADGRFLLAVTDSDLFMPVFTFVLGEAHLGGKAALVSTYRLREERYGLPPNPALLRTRLARAAIHELGHCFGLAHCRNSRCVMYAAASVEEVDLKGDDLCGRCAAAVASSR
ncbi:MAG: matrixin family metalloprotease [Polyangiaceae bacterium]